MDGVCVCVAVAVAADDSSRVWSWRIFGDWIRKIGSFIAFLGGVRAIGFGAHHHLQNFKL